MPSATNYSLAAKVAEACQRVVRRANHDLHKPGDMFFFDGIVQRCELRGNVQNSDGTWRPAKDFKEAPILDIYVLDMKGDIHCAYISKEDGLDECPQNGDHVRAFTHFQYGQKVIRGLIIDGKEVCYKPFVKPPVHHEFPSSDNMFADYILERVDIDSDGEGCTILFDGCMGTGLGYKNSGDLMPFMPSKGDHVRLYSDGPFGTVRGIFVNGKKFRYHTTSEEKQKRIEASRKREEEKQFAWDRDKESLLYRVSQLPECFRNRIARFMKGNPNFGAEFLPYELIVCEQAVLIAAYWLIPAYEVGGAESLAKAYDEAREMSFEDLSKHVEGLEEGLSGNQMGIVMRLAYYYAADLDAAVVAEHGAMVPLVGCKTYGCTHVKHGEDGASWPRNNIAPNIHNVLLREPDSNGTTHDLYYKYRPLKTMVDFHSVVSDIVDREDCESGAKLTECYVEACPQLGYRGVRENLLLLYSKYNFSVPQEKYVEIMALYPEAEIVDIDLEEHESQAIGDAAYIPDLFEEEDLDSLDLLNFDEEEEIDIASLLAEDDEWDDDDDEEWMAELLKESEEGGEDE